MSHTRIGIIGAGVSGLSCARVLLDAGHDISILDRGARPGGRISSRDFGDHSWDPGAQYFTARDRLFVREVMRAVDAGALAEWSPRLVEIDGDEVRTRPEDRRRWVGTPSMESFAAHLARGLPLHTGVEVDALEHRDGRWVASDLDGAEIATFDFVVLALQPSQVLRLVPDAGLAGRVADVELSPCIALMTAWERPAPVDFDAAFVLDHDLSWIARNSSKPGRPREETWIAHASTDWSRAHIDDDPQQWTRDLTEALRDVLAVADGPSVARVKRWRYSLPESVLEERSLIDADLPLAACGDWCSGPRVEGAWLSGHDLAARLLDRL